MPLIDLDFVGTLAAAGLVLFAGYGSSGGCLPWPVQHPAPVIGGLLVALAVTLLRAAGHQPVAFDTTLQAPLMIAFFTSIGFGASVPLLRSGGPRGRLPGPRDGGCRAPEPGRRAGGGGLGVPRSSASLPAR